MFTPCDTCVCVTSCATRVRPPAPPDLQSTCATAHSTRDPHMCARFARAQGHTGGTQQITSLPPHKCCPISASIVCHALHGGPEQRSGSPLLPPPHGYSRGSQNAAGDEGFGAPTNGGRWGPRLHDAPRGVWGGVPHPSSLQTEESGAGGRGARGADGIHAVIPSLPPPPSRSPPQRRRRRRRGPPKSQPMGINLRAGRRRDGGNLPRPPLAKKLKLKHIPPPLCQENTDRSQQPEQGWLRAQQRRAEGDWDRCPPPPPSPFCFFPFFFPANASDRRHLAPVCGGQEKRGGREKGGKGAPRPTALRDGKGMGGRGTGAEARRRRAELHPPQPNLQEGRFGEGARQHPQHPQAPAQPWQG